MEDLDLFSFAQDTSSAKEFNGFPLAVRMRPKALSEFVGQEKVVGKGKLIWTMLQKDSLLSMLFYGPPGTGKTTLAKLIASLTKSAFEQVNAVTAGIAELKKVIAKAQEKLRFYNQRTIVFIDEIHRFNKAQQDVLLPYVESGQLILVGATTENPYFSVNRALLSRVCVIKLEPLNKRQIKLLLQRAIKDEKNGLGNFHLKAQDEALEQIASIAAGDARAALNFLEQAALMALDRNKYLDMALLKELAPEKLQSYDRAGDNHYDVVSAFIKSMRGSDPDAAVHYLARMIAAGEDLQFIARRIVICAAEDVGNADPQALCVANAAMNSALLVGFPEAAIILSQAVTYIASAPKSNASYLAIKKALADIKKKNCGQVPPYLRDAHYSGAEKLGHGIEYKYPHDYPQHFVAQQYLPTALHDASYYNPTENGFESKIRNYLKAIKKLD